MRIKVAVAAFVAVTVGVLVFTRTKNATPSDLRDAVAENLRSQDFNTSISVVGKDNENLPVPKAVTAQ